MLTSPQPSEPIAGTGGTGTTARPPRHRGVASVGVVVIFLGLGALAFWPTGPFDATRLPGGGLGDPVELTWFLAWTPWALIHGHNLFFTHAIDLPGGVNLAQNTTMSILGLLGAPVTASFGPIATFNLLLRLALGCSASTMFFVLRRWCRHDVAAFAGGLAYGFSPALISHLGAYGHIDLVFVALVPVVLWCLDEVFVRQRVRPIRMGALLGAVTAAQFLVSSEVLSDAALLAAIGVAGLALANRHRIRSRWPYLLRALASAIGVFALIAGVPIGYLLFGPGHLRGPVQRTAHLQIFRTDLFEPILPTLREWLSPHGLLAASTRAFAPISHAGGSAEIGGYLGLPLVIVLIAVVLRWRSVPIVRFAAGLGAVAFVLSLGSRLEIDGHVTSLPLPEAVLARLPVLDNTVPARFALFTALFAAIVFAVGIDRAIDAAMRSERRTRRIQIAAVIGGAAICLVALAPRLPVSDEQTALASPMASSIEHLVPKGAVVLSYPYPEPPFAVAMLWQAADRFSFQLLGGYATIEGANGNGQLYPLLGSPPFVQEYLGRAEAAHRSHYPAPAEPVDPVAALCGFVEHNGVTAVLYSPYGPGAAGVATLFGAAFGQPSARSGTIELWRLSSTARRGSGLRPRC